MVLGTEVVACEVTMVVVGGIDTKKYVEHYSSVIVTVQAMILYTFFVSYELTSYDWPSLFFRNCVAIVPGQTTHLMSPVIQFISSSSVRPD